MLKVTSIKKHKNDYTLEFNNGDLLEVSERIVIEYLVSTNKELTMEEYDEIKEKNHYYQVLDKMINTLVHKRLLTSEIKQILKDESKLLVQEILKDLTKLKLVDDKKYILDFINDKASFNHYGKNKIYQALVLKKVDKTLLNEVFLNYDLSLDYESLEKLISLELKSKKKDNAKHYFNHLKTSLVNKGFDLSLIEEVIENNYTSLVDNLDEEESLEKALIKYKGKYEGYKLKQKLYSLGYRMDLINEKLGD